MTATSNFYINSPTDIVGNTDLRMYVERVVVAKLYLYHSHYSFNPFYLLPHIAF